MKKLMVVQYDGKMNGSGIGLLAIMRMMKERFDIVVYCNDTPNHLIKHYDEEGYCVKPVRYIAGFMYLNGGPPLFSVGFLAPLIKMKDAVHEWETIIRHEKPDIVLVNSMVLSWMWKPIKACSAIAICHVREVMPNRRSIRGRYMLQNLEHFDAVWYISEHEKNYFSLRYPSTDIMRDCLTEPLRGETKIDIENLTNDRLNVLYVGGTSRLKGLDTLLRSMHYLEKRIAITIAGYICEDSKTTWKIHDRSHLLKNVLGVISSYNRHKMHNMLQDTIRDYGERITLIGHQKDLSLLYKECDALVFPSKAAHQSRPAFEAGFFGKPVVISDFIQTAESVRHGYNGLTFTPNNPKALAEALNNLMNDCALRKRLGENNYRNSNEKHTYEAVKKHLDDFWLKFEI